MAYLLTMAESYGGSPVYGKVWMEQVWLAFTAPGKLRQLLSTKKLQDRFDYWLRQVPRSEQLDMFD